ncbi:SMI1/KNR4 family protein [Streptomyces sp. LARHCF252]
MTTSAIEASEQVIRLVRENEGFANHADGCTPAVIERAERELGLAFPPSYLLLLEEFGTWEIGAKEFPGIYQTPVRGDVILGTVANTLDDRVGLRLPDHLMVIMRDDVWDVVVLDTSLPDKGKEFPVYSWNPGVLDGGLMEKVADDFGSFALAECRQALSL